MGRTRNALQQLVNNMRLEKKIAIALLALALCMVSACASIRSQPNSNRAVEDEVPTISFCKLLQNPEQFHQKVVRVTAIYENGFEKSYLYDLNCKSQERGGQPVVWVGRDKSFVRNGESEEAKQNRMISGFGRWSVTVVGRFIWARDPERFGHLGCCRYEFDFVRIEKSEKLPDKKP